MAVVEILLLDHVFEVSELVHGARVGAKALLKEAAGGTALIELEKIHSAALIRSPAGDLVDDLADELDPLAAGLALLVSDSLLCAGHGKGRPKPMQPPRQREKVVLSI